MNTPKPTFTITSELHQTLVMTNSANIAKYAAFAVIETAYYDGEPDAIELYADSLFSLVIDVDGLHDVTINDVHYSIYGALNHIADVLENL